MELLYNQQFEVDKAIILAATTGTSHLIVELSMKLQGKLIHLGGKESISIARQLGF